MLLWPLKKLSGRTLFFCELMTVSAIIHLLIGLALFVLYRGQFESFTFDVHSSMSNKGQPVLFLPHRSLRQTKVAHGVHKSTRAHKSVALSSKSKAKAKQAVRQTAAKSKQAVADKKNIAKSATMLMDKQSAVAKKNRPAKNKAVAKETVKEKIIDTAPQKVVEETKPKEESKEQMAQKIVPQEIAPAEDNKIVEQENVPADLNDQQIESFEVAISAENAGNEEDSCGYEGLSPEVARIYYAVQEEVSMRWRPPAGLPKDLVCTITVRLNHEGTIADVHVKQSSGVLIYDLSASNAAQEMQLPRVAWGKEFTIAFRL